MSTIVESRENKMMAVATRLEKENPCWLVVFGVYSKQLIAFPCFPVPPGTMAVETYPRLLVEQMRKIEIAFGDGLIMDFETKAAWEYVISQWGSAYIFMYNPGKSLAFSAQRRDNGKELKARSVEGLRRLVHQDYGGHPVSREAMP